MDLSNINLFDDPNVITSGFKNLDDIIIGFEPGTIIELCGASGIGKTNLTLSMINNISVKQKLSSALFSFDHNRSQIATRLLSISSGICTEKILRKRQKPEEWEIYTHTVSSIGKSKIYIDDTKYTDFSELLAQTKKSIEKHFVNVVFFDRFDLMPIYDKPRRILDLKKLAEELGVAIVINFTVPVNEFSHNLNRSEVAAAIIFFDLVIEIHRPEFFKIYEDEMGNDVRGIAELNVTKNKNGLCGSAKLLYNNQCHSFGDFDDISYNKMRGPAPWEITIDEIQKEKLVMFQEPYTNISEDVEEYKCTPSFILKPEKYELYKNAIQAVANFIDAHNNKSLWDVALFYTILYGLVDKKTSRKKASELFVSIIPTLGESTKLEYCMSKCTFASKKKIDKYEKLSANDELKEYDSTIGKKIKDALS